MTTYVFADNFRGFKNTAFPILQVNFFVGENSTGKSSILELIGVLANVNFWAFDAAYGAPEVPDRHFLDLLSAGSSNKRSFTIGAISFPKAPDKAHGMIVTYVNNEGRPVPSRISVISDNKIRYVEGNFFRQKRSDKFRAFEKTSNKATTSKCEKDRILAFAKTHLSKNNQENIVENLRTRAPVLMRFSDLLFGKSQRKTGEHHFRVPTIARHFVELAPIRTKPKRTYDAPQTAFSPEGEHTPYVIRKKLSASSGKAFKEFLEQIGTSSGLFKSIAVKEYSPEDRAPFEIRIDIDKTSLTIDNVGYGVSQALPVIVEIYIQPKNSTFAIQQPEVHLHPRAQATFGDLIASVARDDEKSFLVETHSDFTIDRYRLNIKKNGNIPSQILYFERLGGANTVTPISIEKDGSISANQPDTYRDFFLNESLSNL